MNAVVQRCTSAQGDFICSLFERLELTTRRFTFQHRAAFRLARLPAPSFDGDINTHLRALTREDASRLITALQQLAGIEEDDD